MLIQNGIANINLIPVANSGGIVSAETPLCDGHDYANVCDTALLRGY
jgi:hypothetical protein